MASPVDQLVGDVQSKSRGRGGISCERSQAQRGSFQLGLGPVEGGAPSGRITSPPRPERYVNQQIVGTDIQPHPICTSNRRRRAASAPRSRCPFARDTEEPVAAPSSAKGRRFQNSHLAAKTGWMAGRTSHTPSLVRLRHDAAESPWALQYPPPPGGETPGRPMHKDTCMRRQLVSAFEEGNATKRNLLTHEGVPDRPHVTRSVSPLAGPSRKRSASAPRPRCTPTDAGTELRQKGKRRAPPEVVSAVRDRGGAQMASNISVISSVFREGLRLEDSTGRSRSVRRTAPAGNSLEGPSVLIREEARQANITPHRRRACPPVCQQESVAKEEEPPICETAQARADSREHRRSQSRPNYWQNKIHHSRGRWVPARDSELTGHLGAPSARGPCFRPGGKAQPSPHRSTMRSAPMDSGGIFFT